MFAGARILVAPLDWGLGHAARCVPLVHALMEQGAVPVIGADKGPLALLATEFPQLEQARIPGVELRYGRGRSMAWMMARQFPAMLRQVRAEHAWLEMHKQALQLDAVISDQRFGLYAPALPSVLITHQLFPFTPVAQGLARRINLQHIAPFDRCWVPDLAEEPGLAGELAHGKRLPANARYIGPLSRFEHAPAAKADHAWRVVAVISGPEPQRSMLEQLVLQQLHAIEGPHLLVAGRPGLEDNQVGPVQVVGHMATPDLHAALLSAELIVGRTGYSTLMDLAAIGRGALLVPTPGQPEQEYLGRLHAANGMHVVQDQRRFHIADVLPHPSDRHAACTGGAARSTALSDLAHLIALRRAHHKT
ncbi:MAG TPA: glycosyltransferase [Flavobacteriales bacterium]|mgnify:CR=1 FL=1|nr:glycosyltransferase [Flavobacteriales bacterium]HRP81200.1 glycosyltransferase [Flavobacteriales bacterium]